MHAWFLASRGLTLGVRAAIIDEHDHVCLVRHTYVAGWHLPGGGVEIGEDALQALARECREEAAIDLTETPRLHGIFFNGPVSRRDHVLVYEVRRFLLAGPRVPDREIAETAFFPLGAPPEGTTRGTRARLDEIVGGQAISQRW